MNIAVPILLFGWIPLVVVLFAGLPSRRAVIAAFLLAWLFLPVAEYRIPGLPDYTKMSATCLGVMLGTMLFDLPRLLSFRPNWIDLPMAIWCACPLASSLSNGLGVYDGLSAVLNQFTAWGLPYLIGRLYFTDAASLKELAVGIFVGGLLYVPLCLYEIRMSPQLHAMLYGYHQHSFAQTIRWGGWRPTVFMQHGLMVGMWMCMASLVGLWLWMSGSVRRVCGMPMGWLLPPLLITAILCKSTGALALLVLGLWALLTARWLRSSLAVWVLLMLSPLYMTLRAGGQWSGQNLVSLAESLTGPQRAGSLQYRMHNEDLLAARALQRPLFGWGGWGRARVKDETSGRDISVTDGLWIIALGNHGVAGLASLTASMLLPGMMLCLRRSVGEWSMPAFGPAAVLAVVVTLYMIDGVPNAMVNPVFILSAGALGALANRYSACRQVWLAARVPPAMHRVDAVMMA
ncbi:O-antigen ligase domain-containing protein [Fontivita pretiosa]|uniref:O-antigen ligase domain-containing protein n=1 Tax=Fontivita pretiosa TaxID=2989684 RepID=UPI003D17AE1F